jgi:uncharacterized protein YdaU (DUF1376 family)
MSSTGQKSKGAVKVIHLSTSDWDYACAGMTCEEEGVFFRIIRLMYRQGGPIRDDERLHRSLRLDPRAWKRLRTSLANLGVLEWIGGMIVQKRVQEEIATVVEKRAKAAEKGANGNAKRWAKPVDKGGIPAELQPGLPFDAPQVEGDCADKEPALRSQVFCNPLKSHETGIATPSPTPIVKKEARERANDGDVKRKSGGYAFGELDPLGVTMTAGVIAMTEPHRAYWRGRFDGDQGLDDALIQAAGYVDPDTPPNLIAAKVASQLMFQIKARRPTASARPVPAGTPRVSPAAQAVIDARRRQAEIIKNLPPRRVTP